MPTASSVFPEVGLVWIADFDPDTDGGVQTPLYQFLIRTDDNVLWYKSGTEATQWASFGGGGGGGGGVSGISAGTQLATSGTVDFVNSNGVSFGMSGSSQITASVAAQSVAPGGISAGTQIGTSGTIVFSNSNLISFGMSGSTRITASAGYVASISAGTVNATGNQIIFSNGSGVSFGANGNTITASVAAQSTAPGAISAGTQLATSGTINFANSNGISFGMSGSSQITASYSNGPTLIQWANNDFGLAKQFTANIFYIDPVAVPGYFSATQQLLLLSVSQSQGSTGTGAFTVSFGVYTISVSTASLASSVSRGFSWTTGSDPTQSSEFGGVSGYRWRTLGGGFSMTPGNYLFGVFFSTANGASISFGGNGIANTIASYDGIESGPNGLWLPGIIQTGTASPMPGSINVTDGNYSRTGAGPEGGAVGISMFAGI